MRLFVDGVNCINNTPRSVSSNNYGKQEIQIQHAANAHVIVTEWMMAMSHAVDPDKYKHTVLLS